MTKFDNLGSPITITNVDRLHKLLNIAKRGHLPFGPFAIVARRTAASKSKLNASYIFFASLAPTGKVSVMPGGNAPIENLEAWIAVHGYTLWVYPGGTAAATTAIMESTAQSAFSPLLLLVAAAGLGVAYYALRVTRA